MAQHSEAAALPALENMKRSTSPLPLFSQPPSKLNRNEDFPDDAISPFIAHLCDDTLLRILSYADLPSLVHFTRGTSHSLRRRFHTVKEFSCCPNIWRETFTSLNFAPIDDVAARGGGPNSLLQEGEFIQTTDYLNAIRQRRALWSILSGSSRRRNRSLSGVGRKTTKQCFSLPNRLFHFVPLVPTDMMHFPPASEGNNNHISFSHLDDGLDENGEENDDFEIDMDHEDVGHLDPPPVEFACDSFSLTSPGTGTEFVLLNPFSGSIEVYASVLDNAISSDESMMEQAMLDASEGIIRKRRSERSTSYDEEDLPDENSEVIAGEAIHHRFQSNHKMYDTPPKQVLFSVHDYFDMDCNEYFGQHTPFANSGRREQGSVTVDWVGVDSHVARNDYTSISGNIIGAARILTMESDHGEEELACTEILAWSNFEQDADAGPSSMYESKYVCRAAGSFYFLDICANYQKLYVAFQSGRCPFNESDMGTADLRRRDDLSSRQLMDIEEESMVNEDGAPIRMSKTVFCLPLIQYDDSPLSPEAISSYFPSPDACMVAQYPVSSFSVDPTGKILVVGTICGTVEIWHTGMNTYNTPTAPPLRLQILSVRESFMKRHRSTTMDERHTSTGRKDANSSFVENEPDDKPNNIEFNGNATETQDDLALLENHTLEEEEFPHKHPTSKISQIYVTHHQPTHQCGFITKQRSPESGTTLLLWQTATMSTDKTQDSVNERFHIMAMINLPLSAQCHPEVHFDGRRLIVFGKDHIGQIFLVYHVLSTRFDQDEFNDTPVHTDPKASRNNRGSSNNGEESGGVVQIAGERRIKFVNRIRHAGLGGLEYYDSMLLAANERFLMVNTKAGNLIGSDGARNASEGLLVIDLQEYGC